MKSKTTIPNTYGRKISALDVESLIADPAGQGYRYVSMFDQKTFALHNVQNLVKDTQTILHIDYYVNDYNDNNVHSEYQLLTEGLASSKPNRDIVNKWIDSLVGYNAQNKQLPDTSVSIARRFGILNTPNQSMFVNRKEALKQIIERVNAVMTQYVVVDEFDISPLMQIDPLPSKFTNNWDTEIESESLLRFVGTAKLQQAKLQPVIVDGTITEVQIINSGRGYIDSNDTSGSVRNGPTVTIEGTGTGAEIKTYINNLGQITSVEVVSGGKNYLDNTSLIVRPFSVLVKNDSGIGGFWAVYNWISSTQEWFRNYIQDYDVTNYWNYIDWYADGYSDLTEIDYLIDNSYELTSLDDRIGNVVKINNVGTGDWLLLEKVNNQVSEDYTVNYKIIGRENGTIKFKDSLYNFAANSIGYDNATFDNTLFDINPVNELRIILRTLRDKIFVNTLKVEYNKLFFSSLRYVLSEQLYVDWMFKTSFIKIKHNLGQLDQDITFDNDTLPSYEAYVKEVKPYKTVIREFVSAYENLEPTNTATTDFDTAPAYSVLDGKILPTRSKVINNTVTNLRSIDTEYPRKFWSDNLGYTITEVKIGSGGRGYTFKPTVKLEGGGGVGATA